MSFKKWMKTVVRCNGGLPSVILGEIEKKIAKEEGKEEGYLQASKEYAGILRSFENRTNERIQKLEEEIKNDKEVIEGYQELIDDLLNERDFIDKTISDLQNKINNVKLLSN